MRFFLRPLFLRLLLLCVMLNLGDAPYMDELIDELGQSMAFATIQDCGPESASRDRQQSVDASKASAKRSLYEELLANVPMPMLDPPSIAPIEPERRLPRVAQSPPPAAPPSFIYKPPRFSAAA